MAAVSTYSAKARREGRYWVVDVDGVGVTQGRSLAEARTMAADLVVAVREVDPAAVVVDMEIALPAGLDVKVKRAKKSRQQLEDLQRQVGDLGRGVVEGLRGAGLSGKDVAVVLGISEQRVSQLASTSNTSSSALGATVPAAPSGVREKKSAIHGGSAAKTAGYKKDKGSKSSTGGKIRASDSR